MSCADNWKMRLLIFLSRAIETYSETRDIIVHCKTAVLENPYIGIDATLVHPNSKPGYTNKSTSTLLCIYFKIILSV